MFRMMIIVLLLLSGCSSKFWASMDRNWQKWNYSEYCHRDLNLSGAFPGGLKYNAVIGTDNDTVFNRYLMRGWYVERGHPGASKLTLTHKKDEND